MFHHNLMVQCTGSRLPTLVHAVFMVHSIGKASHNPIGVLQPLLATLPHTPKQRLNFFLAAETFTPDFGLHSLHPSSLGYTKGTTPPA